MNGHPRRDTDAILRPSKSTPIILYRFYNGITCIHDLGPCFGMNGHFRRDPDVISRLPESTIDFLSVYIGFGSLSRVKMKVLNENPPPCGVWAFFRVLALCVVSIGV